MKIALIGYGQMGRMVELVALERSHTITAKVNSQHWDEKGIRQADVCIMFTHLEGAVEQIETLARMGKNIVIGTTGWDAQMPQVTALVEKYQIGALYSPNFSIGIQLMFQILEKTSKIMGAFKQYDVAGIEYHHHKKKDSPSGTALAMERIIGQDVNFTSVRCGSIPGTHTILYDSPFDTISITHEARTREGFALGAVQAAEWLLGKTGFHSFSTCMQDLLKEHLS